MNKKGEKDMNMVGMLLVIAIGVIVALILLTAAAQQIGGATNTIAMVNQSLTKVVNWTPQYITTCRALSGVVILNATDAAGFAANASVLNAANYTVENNVLDSTTSLSVKITPNANADHKSAWKVSGTCQPTTYIDDSAGRSVALLIVILAALAIAVFALTPTLRSGILDKMGI